MTISAHDFLVSEGAYTHEHIDADFDDGDPENGPGTWGYDEYDIYHGDSHRLIFQRGKFIEMMLIDHAAERAEEVTYDTE